jgi:A/G-specific adenine glycosylase
MLHQRKIAAIVSNVLEWYLKHARDLPWRREPFRNDPYCVYVSEIMLQQTQVKTVIPYWERWMRELPDVKALAASRPERVLKLWEGLGYYSRARNLHRAAQAIASEQGGTFPRSFAEVLALPGVGRYTAGAICSIAFNQPTPVLDGNVTRVLARLFGIRGNPKATAVQSRLWELAAALVQAAHNLEMRAHRRSGSSRGFSKPGPGATVRRFRDPSVIGYCSALNQALMELGAVLCTPRQPRCSGCPLRRTCVARSKGFQESLPNTGARSESTRREMVALVLEHRGRFLVQQRPAGGINAGLWEFPATEVGVEGLKRERELSGAPNSSSALPPSSASVPALAEWGRRIGVTPASFHCIARITHSITRFRIRLEVFQSEVRQLKRPVLRHGRWLTLDQLTALPFTAAHRKILSHLPGGAVP